MAHRPNADPVQEHSAGALYPYVIYRRQKDDGYIWGLLGPYIKDGLEIFSSYDKAARMAQDMKNAKFHIRNTQPLQTLDRRAHSRKPLSHIPVVPPKTVY
jgi:hypothetical protein